MIKCNNSLLCVMFQSWAQAEMFVGGGASLEMPPPPPFKDNEMPAIRK